MSKKTVIRADLIGEKCISEIMSTVAKLEGVKSMDVDQDKCTLTVVGTVDPVCVARQLRKACFAAAIVSVEDDKPKEKKDPCQEACEKACKEDCEKACKAACCDKTVPWQWQGYRCTLGCYTSPCALPGCNYYGYGVHAAPPGVGYRCYEEQSPGAGGECSIQ